MSTSTLDEEKTRQEQELRIQRQIAFATGLFQGDIWNPLPKGATFYFTFSAG